MPIEELLAQVATEHEVLQAKYAEALREISLLHARLAAAHEAEQQLTIEKSCKSLTEYSSEGLRQDTEAAVFQHKVTFASLHATPPPPEDDELGGIDSRERGLVIATTRTSELQFGRNSSMIIREHQNCLQRFLAHPAFETFLVFVLITNCVIMWIDTDRRASMLPTESWLEVSDHLFLAIYVAEFGLRVSAYQYAVLNDRWTRLDFFVIVMDTVSIIVKLIFGTAFLGGVNISLVRLLRVFRVARVFKILRFVSELQLLIHGFYGAMKAVVFAVIMLEIVLLLWCFVLVEAIHPLASAMQCKQCQTAYSSMWQAHLSLVQQVIAGDSWGDVNIIVITAHPETAVIFLGCLITIQFAMLNMIFTVIVDAAHRARESDQKQMLAEKEHKYLKLKKKLLQICRNLDADGDGELEIGELFAGYELNEEFTDILAHLDIGRDDLETLFWIMDEDRSGTVSPVEFVNNIYKLREQDIHTTLMFVKAYLIDLRIKLKEDLRPLMAQNLNVSKTTQKELGGMVDDLGLVVPSPSERTSLRKASTTMASGSAMTKPSADSLRFDQGTAHGEDVHDARNSLILSSLAPHANKHPTTRLPLRL